MTGPAKHASADRLTAALETVGQLIGFVDALIERDQELKHPNAEAVRAARRDLAAADEAVEQAEGALACAELHRDDCRVRLERLLAVDQPAPRHAHDCVALVQPDKPCDYPCPKGARR